MVQRCVFLFMVQDMAHVFTVHSHSRWCSGFSHQAQPHLLIPATLISMSLAGTASLRRCAPLRFEPLFRSLLFARGEFGLFVLLSETERNQKDKQSSERLRGLTFADADL